MKTYEDGQNCQTCNNNGGTRNECQNAECKYEKRDYARGNEDGQREMRERILSPDITNGSNIGCGDKPATVVEKLHDTIRALEITPATAEQQSGEAGDTAKDAARYRWLRSHWVDTSYQENLPFPQSHIQGQPCVATIRIGGTGTDLDAAIDAAMLATPKE